MRPITRKGDIAAWAAGLSFLLYIFLTGMLVVLDRTELLDYLFSVWIYLAIYAVLFLLVLVVRTFGWPNGDKS